MWETYQTKTPPPGSASRSVRGASLWPPRRAAFVRAHNLCRQQRSADSSLPLLWPCGVLRDRALRKQALRAHGAWQREPRVRAATDVDAASSRLRWPAAYARRVRGPIA